MSLSRLRQAAQKEREEKEKREQGNQGQAATSASGAGGKNNTITESGSFSRLKKAAEKEREENPDRYQRSESSALRNVLGGNKRDDTLPDTSKNAAESKRTLREIMAERDASRDRLETAYRDIEDVMSNFGATTDNIWDKLAERYGVTKDEGGRYSFRDQKSWDDYNRVASTLSGLYDTYNAELGVYTGLGTEAENYRTSDKVKGEINALEEQRTNLMKERFQLLNQRANTTQNHARVGEIAQELSAIEKQMKSLDAEYDALKAAERQDMIDSGEYRDASWWDVTWNAAKQGYYNTLKNEAVYDEMWGRENDADYYRNILAGDDYKYLPSNGWEEVVAGAAELAGQMLRQTLNPRTMSAGGAGAVAGAAIGSKAGATAGTTLGPGGTLVGGGGGAIAGGITGFGAGIAAGNAAASLEVEAGAAYEEMLENGISKDTARKVAMVVGGVNAALEAVQVDELLDSYKVLRASGATQGAADALWKKLLDMGVDKAVGVGKETLEEVGQEFSTITGAQVASMLDKGEWAYGGDEVAERLGDTALSSALSFGLLTAPGAAFNATGITMDHKAADNLGKQYKEMTNGRISAEDLIAEGLTHNKTSDAYKVAADVQKKMDAGEAVTDADIGLMVAANERANRAEEKLEEANTPREATSEAENDVSGEADTQPAQEEKPAEAAAVAESDPIVEAAREAVGAEPTAKSDPQKRAAWVESIQKETGYGEHGLKSFVGIVESMNADPKQVRMEYQSAYEAGRVGLSEDVAMLDNTVRREAYNAGKLDAMQDLAAAKDNAKRAVVRKDAGFDMTNLPKDVTRAQAKAVDMLAKATGVRVRMATGLKGNAQINGDGTVLIDETFQREVAGKKRSIVFYAAHEIGMHRLMQLAPKEGQAFINAIIRDANSGLTYGQVTVTEKRHADYAKQNVYLSTGKAMEEVAADSILSLYDNEESFYAAIERVVNGTDEKAKRGAKKLKAIFDDIVKKLKQAIAKLTGKEKAEAKQVLTEVEQLRDMFEKGLAAATKRAKAVSPSENGTKNVAVAGAIQHSVKSFATAAGLEASRDADGKVVFKVDGKVVKKVTPAHIKEKSGLGGLITTALDNGFISGEEAAIQYKAAADIMNMIINTQDPEMVWAWVGSSMFSAIKSNSDGQYGTTVDFTTVCRKTQDMITAMSKAMMKLKRGLTKDEVTKLQAELLAEGSSVPCPVCYVFSRWAGIGSVLDNMYRWQQKYDGYTEAQLNEQIETLTEKLGKGKARELAKLLREQDEEYDQLSFEKEQLALDKKQLTAKKKTAVKNNDAHTLADINNRLAEIDKRNPQITKRMKAIKDSVAPELAWLLQVRTQPDYDRRGKVRADVLFNLDDAATFAEEFPLAWKYRTTRGPSAGKAILPYSDMRLGDIILGVGNTSADGNTLFANATGKFTTYQMQAVDKAIKRAKAQNLIGGQRFQSTSDFRYDYALDYLMAFWENQAIGSKMQTYTKIIEFGDMVAAVGGDFNLSVMPRNKGYITLPNGKNQLVFSSVTGIDFEAAKRSNEMHDNGQLILVGINDEHILAALEDSEETRGAHIGFVIPYHASGASINEFIRVLVSNLGETFTSSYYKDYSDIQSDKERKNATADQKRRNDLRSKLLKGKDGSKSWEPSADDLAFIRGESKSIVGRSFAELREIERKALRGNKAAIAEYESWTAGALWNLYNKMWNGGSEDGVRLNTAQAKSVMPHEYWNKTVNRDQAYINGFLFRSYCYNLGLTPRFSGITVKGERYGDFTDSKGYWKTLIDRPMYNNDGTYRDQQIVNMSKFNKEMLTADYAQKNWEGYSVQEPDVQKATRAAEKFVEETQYSLVKDEDTLDFLNDQEWVKVYRAMYKDETGLYPPMGGIQGGKKVDPVKLKTWYQADENPSLIKFEVPKRFLAGELNNKGKPRKSSRFLTDEEVEANRDVLYGSHKANDVITLASGNTLKFKDLLPKFELKKADGGTDVPAAYNPYFHTSLSALNDQFSTAYKRPGLVVVEGYIPKSELTSGYQAMYAKDPVGETTWKSGVVATNLKGEKARKVFLSRWFRAERVLKDAEAAKMIAGALEGENLKVPWNVVTPKLREALEAAGVEIDYGVVYSGTSFEDFQRESGKQYSLKDSDGNELSEQQQEYFKDSKARDENGNLLVLYHGTLSNEHFSVFQVRRDDETVNGVPIHHGVYTSTNKNVAGEFAAWGIPKMNLIPTATKETHDAVGQHISDRFKAKARIYKVYANLRNPLVVDVKGSSWQNIDNLEEDYPELLENGLSKWADGEGYFDTDSIRMYAYEKGYDGVIIRNVYEGLGYHRGDDVIVFSPEQLKYTDNLNPTEDPDIRFSLKDDEAYMDAYFDGDDDLMQELVDKAAQKAGYTYKAYHRTENAFTVFDRSKARKSMDIQGFYFSADPDAEMEYGSVRYDTYLKMTNPYIVDSSEAQKGIPFDMRNENAGVIARKWLQDHGYDGVIRKAEYFGAEADEYIVFEPNQIKSAELMTFEDDEYGEGDIIPLSKRFDSSNEDIRYSLKDDADRMEQELNNLRQQREDLQDEIDAAYLDDIPQADINKMEARMAKLNVDIDKLVAQERKAAVKTSMNDILANLSSYRRSDLESMAEQISDGNWDDYEDMTRAELEEALREEIDRLELSPLEMQSKRDGLYVRPVSETQFSLKEHNDLLHENANLRETVKDLWDMLRSKDFSKVGEKTLDEMTKGLLKDWQSEADLSEVRSAVKAVYDYIVQGEGGGNPPDLDTVYRMAQDVTGPILEQAVATDDTLYQQYADLRQRLRTVGISISTEYSRDLGSYEDLNDFRRRNFGRLKITKDGLPVDVLYQELADTYPDLFDADEHNHPADQLVHISEVLESLKPVEMNPYSFDMREAATWLTNDLISRICDLPHEARISKIIEENRLLTQEKMKKSRQAGIKYANKKHRESMARASEKKKASIMRAKVVRHAEQMGKKLLRGTDKNHVPEGLKGAVAELLSCINLESNRTYDPETGSYKRNDEGLPTRRTEEFRKIRAEYEAIAANNEIGMVMDPNLLGVPTEGIPSMLDKVIALKDIRLVDMNMEQLETIYDVLRVMEHSIHMAGKMLTRARWATVHEAAEHFMEDTENRKTKTRKTGKVLDIETPYTFFSHFGEAGHDFYRVLRNAQDEEQRMQDKLRERIANVVSLEERKKAEKETVEYTTQRGEKLTLSKAHIMDIYLLNNRQQARQHLLNGGIVQPEVGKVRKGTDAVLLTEFDVASIISKLSDRERSIADGLQKLTLLMAEWGNNASMTVYGIKKFNDPDYWTIHSSNIGINQTVEQGQNKPRSIANMGSAKAVIPEATNTLDIGGAFEVFDRHASDMMCYAAWLAPMEDANRLFNYKYRDANWNPTGKTMKGILDRVGGAGSTQYWMRLMEDIQNGLSAPADTESERGVMKTIGNLKKAAVSGNIRVVIQQPTAYARAAVILGPDVMLAALGKDVAIKPMLAGWNKAVQYAPIAARKAAGGYEVAANPKQLGELLYQPKSKSGKTAQFAKDLPLAGAALMDQLTWGTIWNACEMQVGRNSKDLKKGSAAFYEAVQELFTEVIDQTQVVDGVLQRSQAMRSGSSFMKQMTAFTGEPTQGANIVMRAYDQLRYENDPAKRGKIAKTIGRAVAVYMFTAALNAFAQSLVDGLRDDDDEKEYWEKVWSAFSGANGDEKTWFDFARNIVLAGNMANNVNPMSWIPVWKDVLSVIQGYSVERMDAASLGDFFDSIGNVLKTVEGDGKYTTGYAVLKALTLGHKLLGGSSYNFMRDIEGVIRTFQVETGDYKARYETLKMMTKPENNKKQFMDLLYAAYMDNYAGYQDIYNDLLGYGFTREDLDDAIEDRILGVGLKESGFDSTARYYDEMFNKLVSGDMYGYMQMVEGLEAIGVIDVSSIESAMRSRANKADMSYGDYNELMAAAGLKLKFDVEDVEEETYSIDDLSMSQYSDFVGERGDIIDSIINDFHVNGFGSLDAETANSLLGAAYSFAAETALEHASGGEYDSDTKWINLAQDAQKDLGISPAEYIMLKEEYSASSLAADNVYAAASHGIPVDFYLETRKGMQQFKGDDKQNQIIAYLNKVCTSEAQFYFMMGTEYESWQKKAKYKAYFG